MSLLPTDSQWQTTRPPSFPRGAAPEILKQATPDKRMRSSRRRVSADPASPGARSWPLPSFASQHRASLLPHQVCSTWGHWVHLPKHHLCPHQGQVTPCPGTWLPSTKDTGPAALKGNSERGPRGGVGGVKSHQSPQPRRWVAQMPLSEEDKKWDPDAVPSAGRTVARASPLPDQAWFTLKTCLAGH